MSKGGFLTIFDGFWVTFGDTFESLFAILCDLRCQKVGLDCRRDS